MKKLEFIDGVAECNLFLQQSENEKTDYRSRFERFKNEVLLENYCEESKALNLKTGACISFLGGYDRDIRYIAEVLGFDKEDNIFVLWDCFWSPINPNEKSRELVKYK